MRRHVLLGVDVALILLATSLAFGLRENFEIAEAGCKRSCPISRQPLSYLSLLLQPRV